MKPSLCDKSMVRFPPSTSPEIEGCPVAVPEPESQVPVNPRVNATF